jgi:hypothetical protein
MNERIKELVVESGNGLMRDGKLYPHIGSRTPEDWQRFAELIVKECIFAIDEQCSNSDAEGTIEAITILQKHFRS